MSTTSRVPYFVQVRALKNPSKLRDGCRDVQRQQYNTGAVPGTPYFVLGIQQVLFNGRAEVLDVHVRSRVSEVTTVQAEPRNPVA